MSGVVCVESLRGRATKRHLPQWITQCYLPPDTGDRAPPQHQPDSRYSI